MAKLVNYMNLSTLYFKWSFLDMGLDIPHDISPSPNLVKICYSNQTY